MVLASNSLHLLRDRPIRRQILTVTCLLIVPLALAVAWSADRTRREREVEVREQAGAIATTASAFLSQYLTGVDSMASALARHPAVIALDRERCDRLFAQIIRDQPVFLNLILTDSAGTVKGTAVPAASLNPTISVPYVKDVVQSRKPVVSELSVGMRTGKQTVVLGYPVLDDSGSVAGVLGFGLDLAQLQLVFNRIPLPEGSVVTLTDAKSRVLARSRDAERYIGTPVSAEPFPPREVPVTQVFKGIDGVDRYWGNAVVSRGPWLLSVGIPTTVVMERVIPLWRRNAAIALAGILAMLLAALLLSERLASGLNRLRLAAQRIADGDLTPPDRSHMPNFELHQAQDAFITMASSLREAHDALDHQVEQERRMRETLQSLQRQVVRQERLAAVGVLVSGVAHELNNPLQAILGSAELLERSGWLSGEALEEIAFVKTQSGRAREIIRNLSRFSSQQSGPPTLIELRDVIDEVVQLRRRDLDNSSIALDVDAGSNRKVYANFTELEQVILNFVINAQQSIEGAGRSEGRILIRLQDAGKRVRLEVQDDGPGVGPEVEPKLFQPFFTTKPVGKGTGLGLSVSYGIVESYGGTIGYQRNDWGGATFFFELPAADPSSRAYATENPRAKTSV
ncbi:MAG TPA: ATP-binding protein [Vicinamibacterales bacterium]|nr:ATP-binding protein [Vicinamibacterales bacterium]